MEEHMYGDTFAVEDGHWWFLNLRMILAQSLRECGKAGTGLRILDAGCGTGRNIVFYRGYGQVAGVDLSATALSYCRKRGLGNIARGDVCRLPFRDGSFDVVNSTDVLYAIDPEYGINVLKEICRVLRPGGLLLLNTAAMPVLYSDHDRAVMTRKRYLKSELAALIGRTGLEIVKLRYWNSALFLPVVAHRAARKLINSKSARTSGDLKNQNRFINGLLYAVTRLDWRLGSRLPFGTSLFCLARKRPANSGRSI